MLQSALRLFKKNSKPSFLIIGSEKGGTTALFAYLAKHPQLLRAMQKETEYFNKDILFEKGHDWYESNFPPQYFWQTKQGFEASPGYLYYPQCAKRIMEYNPDIKVIAILRNPVSRAYSAWNMHRQLKHKDHDFLAGRLSTHLPRIAERMREYYNHPYFEDFTKLTSHLISKYQSGNTEEEPSLLLRGLYANQLKKYFDIFPKKQVLVLESAELKNNKTEILDLICEYLSVGKIDWAKTGALDKKQHEREYSNPIPAEAETMLKIFYAPFNEELFSLLGKRYNW